MRINARHLVGVAMGFVLLLALAWTFADRGRRVEFVDLTAPTGALRVELANTPAARASGFSNRDAATGEGMLLQWDAPGRHPIWMSEMRFPLDLVWLDNDGSVIAVLANVPPCTSTPCPLYEPPGSERSVAVLGLIRFGGE